MKFMKLGSKHDAFQEDANSIKCAPSELETDVIINVGEVKFYLHKASVSWLLLDVVHAWLYSLQPQLEAVQFPLLSKSNRLQKLIQEAHEENLYEIHLPDFPGGPKAFEICAKFCYGVTFTLNAYNVVAARCAAEYLEMTENADRGNLILKTEVFLNSGIFHSWKDSIIVLQTTLSLLPWSEDLKIVGRCIDSIVTKTCLDPSNIKWSYTYNRKLLASDRIVDHGIKLQEKVDSVPKDWWVEDLCELDIDLYKRVISAIRTKGRMDVNVIEEALKAYVVRWLPDSVNALAPEVHSMKSKSLVETIICLLLSDLGLGLSCSFMLKLLKFAILIGSDDKPREELIKRISIKLYEASVSDLLIPARSPQTTKYDVELVLSLVNRFMIHDKRSPDLDIAEKNEKIITRDFVLGHASLLKFSKLIDGYLAEIARDLNVMVSSFILLSRSIPESARPIHDGLYKAIDIYLKEHPNLTKGERKKICELMDVKKLTMEASMHAAQNELLPLRLVVQVLFFEQVRAASGFQALKNEKPRENSQSVTRSGEEREEAVVDESRKSLGKRMSLIKMTDGDVPKNGELIKNKGSENRANGIQLLPSRSKRMFEKLWIGGKGHGNGENRRSSETSGSSQSPSSSSMMQMESKSSGSSSRQGRHSIS
ncbi:hypothetical protein U1Q18_002914 [Sarracenia purpurea var. burkii]